MSIIYSSELTADEMKQRRIDRARRRYAEYPRADLEPVEGCNLLADRGGGNLFVRVMRSVLEAQNPSTVSNVSGFFLTEDEEIVFIERPRSGPTTLAELHEQRAAAERDRERQRALEAEQHAAFLATQGEKARRLDLAIKLASMREYRERLKEFRRLRAVGVRCKPPTHYSRTFVYRQAARRLASPEPAATRPRASTPPHDPARPGIVIRRPFGRVIDVY